MSVDHAILGFLSTTPFSGPDLEKAFDAAARCFWPAYQTQVYSTLARLSDSGWIAPEQIEGATRPGLSVYHVTEAGRAELRRWLTAPAKPDASSSPAPAPVFLGGHLTDDEILLTVERAAAHLRTLLAGYRQAPDGPRHRGGRATSPSEDDFWRLTLEYGISWAWAQLGWLEGERERIGSGQRRDA
jgi:PadR family transcriptional regulator AphA